MPIYELLIERLVDLTPLQLDGTNNGPVVCPDEIGEQIDGFLQDVMRLARLEGPSLMQWPSTLVNSKECLTDCY